MSEGAGIMHMLWDCPRLHAYWCMVVYSLMIPRDPLICILGFVEELKPDEPHKLAIASLLYIAMVFSVEPPKMNIFVPA